MAREAHTYRAARRNQCLREFKTVWGPKWYFDRHDSSTSRQRLMQNGERYKPKETQHSLDRQLRLQGKMTGRRFPGVKISLRTPQTRTQRSGRRGA